MFKAILLAGTFFFIGLLAGCGSKDSKDSKGGEGDKRPAQGIEKKGITESGSGVALTGEFFPMPSDRERLITYRRYSPKKYGTPNSPLTMTSEERVIKWLKPDATDKRKDVMYFLLMQTPQTSKTFPANAPIVYRKTPNGIVRCDSFGSAGGQKPLDFEVLEFKWGVKPKDSWTTEVPEKGRLYTATYDRMESIDGSPVAVITITHGDNGKQSQRRRYWLRKGVGVVRYASFSSEDKAWRPAVEFIYSEVKEVMTPLEWESD